MGREIVYCEGCGISLREVDFEKGKAYEVDHRHYCAACRPPETPSAAPKLPLPKISSTRSPVPTGTTPRRPTPAVPPKSNAALIGGAAAGALVLVVLIVVAATSGGSREAPVEKPVPPPAAASSAPERRPAEPTPVRRAAEQREPETLRAPTDQEKSARFDAFIAQIRSMIDQDKTFQRRAEIEGMIAAAEKSAGARPADLQALRAHHAKAFDVHGAAACDAARKEAERLWAEKKYPEAIARAGEIPEAFRGTRPAQELQKWAEDQERRIAEAEARDRERAIAQWKLWKIDTAGSEESGYRPAHGGRAHTYQTHPLERTKPAAFERTVDVPAGKKTLLSFWVAPHAKGDWELRVFADGKQLLKQGVSPPGAPWKQVKVDLTPLAGNRTTLRLENAATGWSWEWGYWADLEITSE